MFLTFNHFKYTNCDFSSYLLWNQVADISNSSILQKVQLTQCYIPSKCSTNTCRLVDYACCQFLFICFKNLIVQACMPTKYNRHLFWVHYGLGSGLYSDEQEIVLAIKKLSYKMIKKLLRPFS